MQGEQLCLNLVGGRITYEQSLLLPLHVLDDGRRVLWDLQLKENPELERLVTGPYRGSFKQLHYMQGWQFREPDGRGRVRAFEAPEEEGMLWLEGEPVLEGGTRLEATRVRSEEVASVTTPQALGT